MGHAAFDIHRNRIRKIAPWVLAVGALTGLVIQSVSLTRFAAKGKSDWSVMYRAAVDLDAGAGPTLYSEIDTASGWPRSLPPFGMLLLWPEAWLAPLPAAMAWLAVNYALLATGGLCLVLVLRHLDFGRDRFAGTTPWAVGLLVLLSIGCVQVGQLSILLATCWLVYLLLAGGRLRWLAAAALAVPAAIKFYPGLLLAVPIALRRWGQVAAFAVALVALSVLLPWAVHGAEFGPIAESYMQHNFLAARDLVTFRVQPDALRNQAVDVALLRYLTADAKFNALAPRVPHLDLTRTQAIRIAHVFRALIVLISAVVSWRWMRRARQTPRYAALMMMALWTAALYLCVPETKDRYAVYTLPAFLPLLAATAEAWRARQTRRCIALGAMGGLCAIFVMGGLPQALLAISLGLLGPAALWAAVLACLRAGPKADETTQ